MNFIVICHLVYEISQTTLSQLLTYSVGAALDDPDPLTLNGRQLLKHVCRAISKWGRTQGSLISVLILSWDYSQVIVTSFWTANARSPQDVYMAATDSIYWKRNRSHEMYVDKSQNKACLGMWEKEVFTLASKFTPCSWWRIL